MKAVGFKKTGGPEVLESLELPYPSSDPDDVIIQTKAVGVNFADIYRRRGEYPSEPPSPFILGHEGAGVIHCVGSNVKNFVVGDRVAFAHVPRSNAEFVRAPAWKVIPLPQDISFEVAASILLQGLTAHYLTFDSFNVKAKDTVLIHSASGGVGLRLIQICKIKGAKTIGTVSSKDKVEAALKAGADHVIVREEGLWENLTLEHTHRTGVDVAFDAIGSTLEKTLSVVRPGGTAVYYGWAGGPPPKIDPQILMSDSKSLVGGDLWSHISDNQALLKRSGALFTWLREGKISSQISREYPLKEVASAHRALESGRTSGKILLCV